MASLRWHSVIGYRPGPSAAATSHRNGGSGSSRRTTTRVTSCRISRTARTKPRARCGRSGRRALRLAERRRGDYLAERAQRPHRPQDRRLSFGWDGARDPHRSRKANRRVTRSRRRTRSVRRRSHRTRGVARFLVRARRALRDALARPPRFALAARYGGARCGSTKVTATPLGSRIVHSSVPHGRSPSAPSGWTMPALLAPA